MLSRLEIATAIMQLPPDKQAAAAAAALQLYGPADRAGDFEPTRYDPARYIKERLGWEPWAGDGEHPGQKEILDAYVLALRQQHERRDYQAGLIEENDLSYWKPGEKIKNWIRVEAGHTVGKTKCLSGLVNHFFDHFRPSIIYTFAPTYKQIHDLLWKEIKTDRRGKGLPGKINDLELKISDNHFANGTATNDAGGKGTERVQGQHGEFLMFVLDEAEGVADFVYDAVESMTSGGITIVILAANPRTRTSQFHKAGALSKVKSFRMSCLYHPNVVAGREIVPGAVKRDYIESMLEKHADVVAQHSEDNYTFELPFPVTIKEVVYKPGTIFLPDSEFLFRVLGIAPANISDKNLITTGRYEASVKRERKSNHPERLRMGLDVARFGKDYSTLYIRHDGAVWREAQFYHLNSIEIYQAIKEAALRLKRESVEGLEYEKLSEVKAKGITSLHVRADGGGGFGSGVIDNLRADEELREAFSDFQVFECHFNGAPEDEDAFADCITEWTADVAESLKGVALIDPPDELEQDLCERQYKWVNKSGKSVKKLEEKDKFRERIHRSPDDGDGCVLCVASDHLFSGVAPDVW